MNCTRINALIYALTMVGLVLDFIGVYKLFFLREKNIKEINLTTYWDEVGAEGNISGYTMPETLKNLLKDINRAIKEMNEGNQLILSGSTKWLGLIGIGFLLQFVSSVLGFVCSL